MSANRNALIRYKTIDNCLQNRSHQWTLEDLIEACSNALFEYDRTEKGVSKRTIQMDIQTMRNENLGYKAPIVVYENKYYTYEDENFSITKAPLNGEDLKTMLEAIAVLNQFKAFSYFSEMSETVSRLEDYARSVRQKTNCAMDFEKNENPKSGKYLDEIYRAIVNKQTLCITYQSVKIDEEKPCILYPYLLKEYRNRWFLFGMLKDTKAFVNFDLNCITNFEIVKNEHFEENTFFDPTLFFDNLVGVTKSLNMKAEKVIFEANSQHAPSILANPIHKSQKLVEKMKDGGMIFELDVVINVELQREFFAFGEGVTVLQPKFLAKSIHKGLKKATKNYKKED